MPFSTEEEKLFYKPQAKRTEPSVELSGVIPDSALLPETNVKAVSKMLDKIELLNKGFAAIAKDYAKMIDVLKIRAGYLQLNMPILSEAKNNPALANASLTLFGTIAESLSYDQYVDLVLYGKEISSSVISQVASVTDYDSIPTVFGQAINSNPITAAVQTLTKSYGNFLVKQNAAEFLSVNQYASGIASANGNKSSLEQGKRYFESISPTDPSPGSDSDPGEIRVPPTYSGYIDPHLQSNSSQSIHDKYEGSIESAIKNLKSKKAEEWLKECIPCSFRAYENGDVVEGVFVDWLNAMSASFFDSLSQLLNAKFPLLNLNIKNDLCGLIAALVNFVCVPDLVSLVSMFTMMVAKLQAKINIAFNIDFSFSVTFIMDLVSNLLNLILNKLMEIVDIVLSPIECVLLALNTQMSKLYAGYATRTITGYIQPRQYVDVFTQKVKSTKDNIDAVVRQFSENIAKSLRFSKSKSSESTYLLFDLNETKFLLSLVTEIVNISIAMHKVSKTGELKKMTLAEIIDYLCGNYTGGAPWMERINVALSEARTITSNAIEKLRPDENNNTPSSSNASQQTSSADNNVGGLAPNDFTLTKPNQQTIISVDNSIPADFFNDDALGLMDTPEYQELLDSVDYSQFESLEQGEANFKFDNEVLSSYKSNKQLLFDTYNQVNRKLSSTNGIELQFMPTTYIDFSNCYQNVGIDNYSESFINELINRVKQS